jgi:hypothetical protein
MTHTTTRVGRPTYVGTTPILDVPPGTPILYETVTIVTTVAGNGLTTTDRHKRVIAGIVGITTGMDIQPMTGIPYVPVFRGDERIPIESTAYVTVLDTPA